MPSLTVQVVENGDPVPSKKVTLFHSGGGPFNLIGTNSQEWTDENGTAEFGYIPGGTTEIWVDGEELQTLHVSDNDKHKYSNTA
jgi:hypothetical protein